MRRLLMRAAAAGIRRIFGRLWIFCPEIAKNMDIRQNYRKGGLYMPIKNWLYHYRLPLLLCGTALAVSLPLAHSGRTRLQAFGAGAASGLVEPLGALAAFALAGWVQAALPWLMSAAAGCMVCVTAQEMIPEAVEQDEPAGVVSIVLGFALMMALDVAL